MLQRDRVMMPHHTRALLARYVLHNSPTRGPSSYRAETRMKSIPTQRQMNIHRPGNRTKRNDYKASIMSFYRAGASTTKSPRYHSTAFHHPRARTIQTPLHTVICSAVIESAHEPQSYIAANPHPLPWNKETLLQSIHIPL
jgi:hypothetical protein